MSDAKKNGFKSIDELKYLYEFRTPTKWIDNIKYTILDSMYTRTTQSNTAFMPHIVFSHGYNSRHECGFETLQQVLKHVMEYFV
jgi:hypothetical protein